MKNDLEFWTLAIHWIELNSILYFLAELSYPSCKDFSIYVQYRCQSEDWKKGGGSINDGSLSSCFPKNCIRLIQRKGQDFLNTISDFEYDLHGFPHDLRII